MGKFMDRPMVTAETEGLAVPRHRWWRRNWKWILGLLVAALILSRFSLHFGYIDEDKKEAVELIERFHQQMNAGRFEEMYEGAHPAFQSALTKREWVRHMQESRAQYGLFIVAKSSKLNVIMGAPVQIRAAYLSSFGKGEATELFSFARDGHNVRLLIYGISPGNTFKSSLSSP